MNHSKSKSIKGSDPFCKSKLSGIRISIRYIQDKIRQIEDDKKSEDNQSSDSGDFANQIKMLESFVGEKREDEIQVYQEIEMKKLQEEEAKRQESGREQEIFEFMLYKEEEAKLREFCKDNGIEIVEPKKQLPQAIKEILENGPRATRNASNSREM